jgi:hypothetical protein
MHMITNFKSCECDKAAPPKNYPSLFGPKPFPAAKPCSFPPLFPSIAPGFIQQPAVPPAPTGPPPAPPPATVQVASQAPVATHRPNQKVPEPPRFSGDTAKLPLEQWIRAVELWFRATGVTEDHDKLDRALMLLEGNTETYMRNIINAIINGDTSHTWNTVKENLNALYQDVDPVKRAREQLEKVCKKNYTTMTKFAEEFRPVASLLGFKDEDLINRIEKHFSDELRNLVVSLKIQNASIILMTWPLFLQQAVKWDNNLRTQKTTNKTEEKKATTSTPRTEKVNELQKLNAEQKKWASKGKCIRCGKKYGNKHQCDKSEKKYRGKFDLSDMP